MIEKIIDETKGVNAANYFSQNSRNKRKMLTLIKFSMKPLSKKNI